MTTQELIEASVSASWATMRLGLDRIEALLALMGNPERQLRFVHVAGTNGKGSFCALLSSILQEAGYRVGLYTSPHLVRLNERYQINRHEIEDGELLRLAEYAGGLAQDMDERPTEFELLTAMAFKYFADERCDIVVLETGLGGRLDATNVIPPPELAALMNIGLEHTEYLGTTLAQIAAEKAGILKNGSLAVSYGQCAEVRAVFEKIAAERGVALEFADFSRLKILSSDREGQSFSYDGETYFIPLLGEHQCKNAAVAITAAKALRGRGFEITDEAIRRGLARAVWQARLEILRNEPLFILDGAHNPQCAESLAAALPGLLRGERAVFLVGVLADKDYPQMLRQMLPLAREFVTLTPDSPRALSSEALCEFLRGEGAVARACGSVAEGLDAALSAAEGGAVVAFGSLYMAGALREGFRAALRRRMRKNGIAAREALTKEDRARFSAIICEKIAALPEYKEARTIMSYRAVRGEVSLEGLNNRAEAEGKRVVYPLCTSKTEMQALIPGGWQRGAFGIPEPAPELSELIPPEEIDLVICPCTAFDEQKTRIGMGAGYYDRYLPNCKAAQIIAAAFTAQKESNIPTEPWDYRMTKVITEE